MFDHVTIRVSDLHASRDFYAVALGDPTHDGDFVEWGDFSISAGVPVTRQLHVAFGAPDRAAVNAWWQKLVDAGYRSDGEPGLRPQYHETYYGGFVLDPDGNSVEAVHHHISAPAGLDHLWLRTQDVAAARAFYEAVASPANLRLVFDAADRVRFGTGNGSFTFVAGEQQTENVHLAFSAADNATVDEFYRLALAAGGRDNGDPGERPQYHAGYYGAYVLDPDGHNVESVAHNR